MAKQESPNIGILLVSHGFLGKHFLEAARIICQHDLPGVESLSIKASYERNEVHKQLNGSMARLATQTNEVIALCDTYGATPSRILCSNCYQQRVKCVFGLNLPMLLDCINLRGKLELDELCQRICQAGAEGIFARDAANGEKAPEAG